MNDADIATHAQPVWMPQANFLIFADLNDHGMQGRLEQLWAKQLGEAELMICCIPFFTYGIALGDVVRTSPQEERRYIIEEVREKSGHRVTRLWQKGVDEDGRGEIDLFIREQHLLFEWYSRNLLALDIPKNLVDADEVRAFLDQLSTRRGASWEPGD